MKVIAGVVLAGALAGGAVLLAGPSTIHHPPSTGLASPPAKPEPPKGPPKVDYVAWCGAVNGYMDGPRYEATGGHRFGLGPGQFDEAGNIWWGGRCLIADSGLITTVFGDDCWSSYLPIDEGPADNYSGYNASAGFGQSAGDCTIQGRPLEGGDKGCLYVATGSRVSRIWKNADKGGRWWFKRIIGEGKTPAPQTKGQSVPALEASLGINMIGILPGNRLIVFGGGSFYEYRDDKLVCLLGYDEYSKNVPKGENGKVMSRASLGVMGGDGSFYVGYYFGGPPRVDRILPDGKGESYLFGVANNARDGAGMQMGMFCGPHIWMHMNNYRYIPPDCLFLHSHDDSYMRRARNGRVATLCTDGEWRELKDFSKAMSCFRSWQPGPNGMASVAVHKGGTGIVTGIDFGKPVVGPPLEGSGAPVSDSKKQGR